MVVASFSGLPEVVEDMILRNLDYTSLARYELCSSQQRHAAVAAWRASSDTLDRLYGKINYMLCSRQQLQLLGGSSSASSCDSSICSRIVEQERASSSSRTKTQDMNTRTYHARLIAGVKRGIAQRDGLSLAKTIHTHRIHCRLAGIAQRYLHMILVRDDMLAISIRDSLDRKRWNKFLTQNRKDLDGCFDSTSVIFRNLLVQQPRHPHHLEAASINMNVNQQQRRNQQETHQSQRPTTHEILMRVDPGRTMLDDNLQGNQDNNNVVEDLRANASEERLSFFTPASTTRSSDTTNISTIDNDVGDVVCPPGIRNEANCVEQPPSLTEIAMRMRNILQHQEVSQHPVVDEHR